MVLANISLDGASAGFESLPNGLVVIDFWADWCRPCKAFSPIFRKLAKEFASSGITFFTADIEANRDWVKNELNINSIPCIILYRNGSEINRFSGTMVSEELLAKVLATLADGTGY